MNAVRDGLLVGGLLLVHEERKLCKRRWFSRSRPREEAERLSFIVYKLSHKMIS
jgi:hypothetical protein